MSPRLLVTLVCAGLGACTRGDRPMLQASWVGRDTGEIAGTPRLAWCPDGRRLELTLADGDRGLGLALYPRQGLGMPDSFRAWGPPATMVKRPSAIAALRWFGQQRVAGYQSDSGAAVTTGDSLRLSGRFAFRLHEVSQPETLHLTGQFHDLHPGACPLDSVTPPADSVPSPTDSVSPGPPGD